MYDASFCDIVKPCSKKKKKKPLRLRKTGGISGIT